MPRGFFQSLTLVSKSPLTLVPACGQCGLFKKCNSPKMPYSGRGRKKILICGEAPGQNEDIQNRQFCGKTGQYLESVLKKLGIDMRRDCWLTNAAICRPVSNQTPSDKIIGYCRPNLIKTIDELKPEIIIPLGGTAVKSLIGWLWKEDPGSINRWIGWHIPNIQLNSWICPTWHPSFVVRNDYGNSGQDRGKGNEVREMIFENHLKKALSLHSRPFDTIPDYVSPLKCFVDPDEALDHLDAMLRRAERCNTPIAFDYETDRLKPDPKDARILCVSLSDGYASIAFPFCGKNLKRTFTEFLSSRIWKIASNLKFEHRWSRKILGVRVRNWKWDTMLAAHTLDSRPGISGLKFQAFVTLGVTSYDDAVKPFMSAKNSNSKNRLDEVSMLPLLRYCATDSLLEYHLAQKQMEKFE